jgi:hypothetical protein
MKSSFLTIIIIVPLFLLCRPSYAQQDRPERDRPGGEQRKPFDREAFFAKRNAFIVEKMGLTAEETAVFIPVENELIQKKFEAGRECFRLERELRGKAEKTDAEYQKLLQCQQEAKDKRDLLDKEYLEKFKKILKAEQILKYQAADKEFFDKMMHERRRD